MNLRTLTAVALLASAATGASAQQVPFGPPTLTHQEIEEITRYLTTLRGTGGATRQPEFRDTFPEPIKPRDKS